MAVSADYDDLAPAVGRLLQRLIAGEQPILAAAGISMWEYVVLDRLVSGPAESQAELARRTGRDQTRLIGHLDALAEAGLIERAPAPEDRRQRVISITAAGRARHLKVKRGIAAMEVELLSELPQARAARLRADLTALAGTPPD